MFPVVLVALVVAVVGANDSDQKLCSKLANSTPGIQCKADGSFEEKQCDGSTGDCWCVDSTSGIEIKGTLKGPGNGEVLCGELCGSPSPVDGKYGAWGTYGDCSKTCGGGVQTRTRLCNNPVSANGGKYCEGPSEETQACNTAVCNGVVEEKECSMNAFNDLTTQLQDLNQKYAKEGAEKDQLNERLKEAKMALDHELGQLTQENQQLRNSNHKLSTQNTELLTELNAAKNQVSKVEVQLESSLKQREHLKEEIESITQNSAQKDNHLRT